MKDEKKIQVDCAIYIDTLSNLTEPLDLREAVKDQINQSHYETDCIEAELEEESVEKFEEADVDTLMKYISIDEKGIEFDYDESVACNDRRMAAFRVPIEFNETRFMAENVQEMVWTKQEIIEALQQASHECTDDAEYGGILTAGVSILGVTRAELDEKLYE